MSRHAGRHLLSQIINNTRHFLNNPSKCCRRYSSTSFGLLVDIDGVLTRGSKTIQPAVHAFDKISDQNGNLKHPVVFLTNGSYRSEHDKAVSLSEMLNVNISGDQVVLVNTPLRDFTSWHDKNVFFAGQGSNLKSIAQDLGFKKPVVLRDVLRDIPMFDVVDKRANGKSGSLPEVLPEYVPIDRIVIANTPVNWESHIQFLLDLLFTNGALRSFSSTQIPLLACNPDLVWAAEYHQPRLANGAFVQSLASLYKEMSGRRLDITWCGKPTPVTYSYALNKLRDQAQLLGVKLGDVFGIGDNIDVDVVGANNNSVNSVLVCTGLYKDKSGLVFEQDLALPSKRTSVKEPIHCKYVARDIGIFVDHLIQQ